MMIWILKTVLDVSLLFAGVNLIRFAIKRLVCNLKKIGSMIDERTDKYIESKSKPRKRSRK